jgi:hypothetical protein
LPTIGQPSRILSAGIRVDGKTIATSQRTTTSIQDPRTTESAGTNADAESGNARWTLRWELVPNAFAAASGDRWPTAGTHGPKTRSTDRRANPRRNAGKR